MRDTETLFRLWRARLAARGHPAALVWLPHQAPTLQDKVYYRPVEPPLTRPEVSPGVHLLPPQDAGAFTLLGCTTKSFVSLCMDPFGSDEEFVESHNFYFAPEPYPEPLERVGSRSSWIWRKHVLGALKHRLSALDYAFSLGHAR